MNIKQIYTNCLSQASYLIESEGDCLIIDPIRDIDQYVEIIEKNNYNLKYVLEKGCKTDDKLICYICKDYIPQVLNVRFNYYTIFNPDKLKCLKYVIENNYFDFTKNNFIDDVIKFCGDLNIILYLKEKGFIKQKEENFWNNKCKDLNNL